VAAQVKLSGITVAQFDTAAKTSFKQVIATGMGVTAADVTITAVGAGRRAGVNVDFKVQVASASAQTAGVSKLSTFCGGAGFKSALVAKGGSLASVTGTAVTKAPAAKTETPSVSPTPAPPPAPKQTCCVCYKGGTLKPSKPSTPCNGCKVINYSLSLTGVTKAQFTPAVQEAFKHAIVDGIKSTALKTTDVKITKIVAVTRRAAGLKVSFQLNTGSTDATVASGIQTALHAYISDTSSAGFLSQFNTLAHTACVATDGCSNIKATAVVPDPTGGSVTTASSSDSDSSFAGWKIAVIVIACLICLAIVFGVLFAVFARKEEPTDTKISTAGNVVPVHNEGSVPQMGPDTYTRNTPGYKRDAGQGAEGHVGRV
jgi:hypothetical protein